MKRWIWAVAVLGLLIGPVVSTTTSQTPESRKKKLKAFMHYKLIHMEKVLEGITTKKFDLISHHSNQMVLASHETEWKVIRTPDYLQHSVEFRRAAVAIGKAAEKKSIDGATLAYLDTTMKCVSCHKYVRGVRLGRADWRLDTRLANSPSRTGSEHQGSE